MPSASFIFKTPAPLGAPWIAQSLWRIAPAACAASHAPMFIIISTLRLFVTEMAAICTGKDKNHHIAVVDPRK
jgi:hypothetical protein